MDRDSRHDHIRYKFFETLLFQNRGIGSLETLTFEIRSHEFLFSNDSFSDNAGMNSSKFHLIKLLGGIIEWFRSVDQDATIYDKNLLKKLCFGTKKPVTM